ncbi:MAG: amidohydrolase family protein [Victivallales bacterium]|jgi:N-acetylglucosamine-6-phosphate deacetylase|nr:amidohydrolase family protein [Victivallales bacterium]
MAAETLLIKNAQLVRPGVGIEGGSLAVRDGRITAVGDLGPANAEPDEVLDARGALLTPGLIDVHTHGIEHYRYDAGPEELLAASSKLGSYGCTCAFPTLIGRGGDAFVEFVAQMAGVLSKVTDAAMPGLHLEGPFMGHTGAGCDIVPTDLGFVRDVVAAGAGRVAIMSLSPEVSGIVPVIELLVAEGIVPFITHTLAGLEDTQRALDAGARHATHFYDVFYAPPETDLGKRPAGCVEAMMADRRATLDFICDGVHVEPTVVKMGLVCKGWENVLLITDSNIGAGLPAGKYDTPWGFRIDVHPDNGARIIPPHKYEGSLAGSSLTMNRGMANLHAWFADEFLSEQLWALGTRNPARLLGLPAKGVLQVGADADLVLWGEDFEPVATWVGGRRVHG